ASTTVRAYGSKPTPASQDASGSSGATAASQGGGSASSARSAASAAGPSARRPSSRVARAPEDGTGRHDAPSTATLVDTLLLAGCGRLRDPGLYKPRDGEPPGTRRTPPRAGNAQARRRGCA